jgi:hypothetical protein
MVAILAVDGKSSAGGYVNPNISVQLRSFGLDIWPPHEVDAGLLPGAYATTKHPPTVPAIPINAVDGLSYRDDYYYHLIVTPTLLDLGNLLAAQTRDVKLWNAYLEPVDVTALVVSDMEGFSIVPPAGFGVTPFILAPLQEITYQVTASLDGPPNLNTTVLWQTDHGDAQSRVLGSRVTIFPFLPDWSAGIDETISARSSVLRAPDGTEQSISLRERYRRKYSVPYTLRDENAQMAENLLFGWQDRTYGVPAWPEQDYLTANTVAGSDTLAVPTVNKTIKVGSIIMVFTGRDVLNAEIREVLSMTTSSVKTKTPFTVDWPAGSRVVPVLLGAAAPQLQGSHFVPTYLQVGIEFNLQPLNTDDNAPDTAPAATYRGYEVYLGRTNWRDGLSASFQNDVRVVDMQTGMFRLIPQAGFSNIGRSHMWFLKTLADAAAFRQWLKRRRGKTVGVWMPSATDDFTMASVTSSTTTAVIVKTNGYASMVKQHPARRDIFVQLRSGPNYSRRITDSLDNGDGTTTLTIDAAFGATINPNDVKQFSFLTFYRMVSDDTILHWHMPGKAEAITGLISAKALQ